MQKHFLDKDTSLPTNLTANSSLVLCATLYLCVTSIVHLGWGWPQLYMIIVWPEIWRGIYFGRLAVLEQSANIIHQNTS